MKKPYDRQRIQKRAILGWLILASGFILQFALEKLLWGESRPDMAAYIIGVPFSIGGLIFGHALITMLRGEPERTLYFSDQDKSAIYQANMIKLRQRLPIAIFFIISGFCCFFLFITNRGQMFFIGVPIAFIGVIGMIYCYHRYARCPACNHLPTNKTHNSVATNLQHCPNCGARLGDVV